jgi:hypothetical protein
MRRSSADQRAAEPLDRLVVEIAGVDAAQRLALHQLAQELDQRQHELRQSRVPRSRGRRGSEAPRSSP